MCNNSLLFRLLMLFSVSVLGFAQNVVTNPSVSRNIVQPSGTQFSANNLANILVVTSSFNWSQTPGGSLLPGGNPQLVTLSPCPLGMDQNSTANNYIYEVYISGGVGTPEAAPVTGGSGTAGSDSCKIQFNVQNSHTGSWAVGSASSGIQEAWNDAWVNDIGGAPNASSQAAPYVKLGSNTTYNIHAAVYLRGRGGVLDGNGALLACSTRDRCIYVGLTSAFPAVTSHKLYNLSGTSTVTSAGVNVNSISASSGTYTIGTVQTATNVFSTVNSSGIADWAACEVHSNTSEQTFVAQVTSVSTNQLTVNFGGATFSAAPYTFGFCNLLNTFIENNSEHVVLQDLHIFQSNPAGMGYFDYGVTNDNDQQFIVERATNRASCSINPCPGSGGTNASTWPIGSFFFQRFDQGLSGITYVHNSDLTNVNCFMGGGNGMVISDSVCQGNPVYGIRYFGGLQPATISNIYNEQGGGIPNPLYGGLGASTGYIVGGGSAGGGSRFVGNFPLSGQVPTFPVTGGAGACTQENYFVIANGAAGPTSPMYIGSTATTGCNIGSGTATIIWPSLSQKDSLGASTGTITYDLLKTTGTHTPPYVGATAGSAYYVVETGSTGVTCDSTGMCSVSSSVGNLPGTGYTMNPATFGPQFWFWPTTLVINTCPLTMDSVLTLPSAVAACNNRSTAIIAPRLANFGPLAQRSPIITESPSVDAGFASILTQVTPANNSPAANSKGRINLGKPVTNLPIDLITLSDSAFDKTTATAGGRPSNDANDMAIGIDVTGGMNLRAQNQIDFNIGSVPSGSNYLERLTSSLKFFAVPVTVTGNVTTSGHLNQNATGNFAGTCTMSASTTCTITISAAYSFTPGCVVSVQGSTPIAAACSVSSTTITITAASSNSAKWAAFLFGNPN